MECELEVLNANTGEQATYLVTMRSVPVFTATKKRTVIEGRPTYCLTDVHRLAQRFVDEGPS